MRNHRKIKALRNKFGSVLGYAFWSMFIEYLTELDGNEFEFSDTECEMFAGELGISGAEIRSLIDYCIQIELLFLKDGFISSESLDENLAPVYDKRGREKQKSKKQLRKNGKFVGNNTANDGITVAETPHIKVEESKVKEIILYLNQKTQKTFRQDNTKTIKLINARFKEKNSLEDFKKVIDIKVKQWQNDDKMKIYLRPETLFGTKFESYLQEEKKQNLNPSLKKPEEKNYFSPLEYEKELKEWEARQ